VHCLAGPILVAVLPILAVSFGGDSHFHQLMLWLVVPTSVAGFGLGFRRHSRRGIVLIGSAGVGTLAVAAIWGHSLWPATFEIAVSVLGSLVLGFGHWLNFQAVRQTHRHR
jgi:hypothetical protein